jgi:hypothetical protein
MRILMLIIVVAILTGAVVFLGCGSDSPSPQPVTGVSLEPEQMKVELAHAKEITATVNGDNKKITWYVNGIENGNDELGKISQNSPATYTAPNWLPDPAGVVIKAVSDEDSTMLDSCMVTITFDKLFVDPVNGNDANHGIIDLPFQTLTHAFTEVDIGGTVVAQPGTYSQASGEDIPIICHRDSVTIVGMDWEDCIIRGSGTTAYQAAVSIGKIGTTFRKFTIQNGPPEDTSSVLIYVFGLDVHIDSVRVGERADYEVIRGEGSGGTNLLIENCYFVVNDGKLLERGIYLIDNSVGAIVRNCTFKGFWVGLECKQNCDALVEGCVIEENDFGIVVKHESWDGSLNPDFGGGARGSQGGNFIRDNARCGLRIELDHSIYAKFNTWNNETPEAGTDYCIEGDGGVFY